VSFVDASRGYAVGDDGAVLVTSNGGATWSARLVGTNAGFTSLSFVDAATGGSRGSTARSC